MTTTNTVLHKLAWFAVTDAESCRLLRCSFTPRGKYHVDEKASFVNTVREEEHLRLRTSGGTTHYVENRELRFAVDIIRWLQKQAVLNRIRSLVLFAPPRMLGVLRMVPLGSLNGRVEELKGDLMRLSAGQLADHPMVRDLLPSLQSDQGAALKVAMYVEARIP